DTHRANTLGCMISHGGLRISGFAIQRPSNGRGSEFPGKSMPGHTPVLGAREASTSGCGLPRSHVMEYFSSNECEDNNGTKMKARNLLVASACIFAVGST